jgi:hypothetical protein
VRHDMHKIIVTRPRVGGGPIEKWGRRRERGRRNDPEDAPLREPMRPRWNHAVRKEFSDLLGPLERWIRKSVGRPWDDVYSEACGVASLDGTVRRHLRQHVEGLVERNVVMVGGEPYAHGFIGFRPIRPYGGGTAFYVCPETGRLRAIAGPGRR